MPIRASAAVPGVIRNDVIDQSRALYGRIWVSSMALAQTAGTCLFAASRLSVLLDLRQEVLMEIREGSDLHALMMEFFLGLDCSRGVLRGV